MAVCNQTKARRHGMYCDSVFKPVYATDSRVLRFSPS